MTTIDISGASEEVQKVVEMLGDHFKAELNTILLGFFHRLSHDNLTLEDVCRVGAQYGLDIEKTYLEMFAQSIEDDDE